MSIAAAKQRLRREMGERRRRVLASARADAGNAVMEHVLSWPELRPGRRVALHAALSDEVPTHPLMTALLARGHPLLLPRARSDDRLEFVPVRDLAVLVLGRFGALEPPPWDAAVPLVPGDLVMLPGVAFDRRGARLGRGGGWYDRSLPDDVNDLFGIAYEFQVVEAVPATATDRRVRGVFTERGLHRWDPASNAREPGADPS